MTKSISKLLIICIILMGFSNSVLAQEYNSIKIPKNTKLIDKFDKFPAGVVVGGEFFYGILISEDEFDSIVLDKIELNSSREKLKIYETFDTQINGLFSQYHNITIQKLNEMEKILNQKEPVSFWDENKVWITLGIGILIGVISYKVSTL
jgi:hypothetical protein